MSEPGLIAQGRAAFAARRWLEAHEHLSVAREQGEIEPDDLELFAAAAYLTGHDAGAVSAWTQLCQLHSDTGAFDKAAKACFWLSFIHMLAGEMAPASGWLSRAGRLVDQHGADCAAKGYLSVLHGLRALGGADPAAALQAFGQTLSISRRFAENDLLALGLLGEGQVLALQGRVGEGTNRLDEAMVGVSGGDVSPVLAGIIYCAVILTCQRIFDVQRAREWTFELNDWCTAQPDLVPFRGQCLVHRSEILQSQGDWPGARDEARKACRQLEARGDSIAGRAFYQRGELHRLCGEFDEADRMYQEAGLHGRDPQPGAALLLLMQGKPKNAAAAIRSAIGQTDPSQGPGAGPAAPPLLAAYVEIMLAVGQRDPARAATAELAEQAGRNGAALLAAWAAQSRGLVASAGADFAGAQTSLREAWTLWQQLECPYEAARVRVWLAAASAGAGDDQAAHHHRIAARAVFDRLGALPDLAACETESLHSGSGDNFGLSDRELEILAMVSGGATNRQIAAQLHISPHTVARHLSNIFDKLGVTTRTAAGAFAHTHDLINSANSQN